MTATATIYLHDGTPVSVDAEDYPRLSKYRWSKTSHGYARTGARSHRMHRMIVNAPKGKVVDHINGDIHDNRKANLRICTPGENSKNHRKVQVTYDKRYGTWAAQIRVNYQPLSLGSYANREDALAAYRSAAAYYYGEFARVPAEPKSSERLLYESRLKRKPGFVGVRKHRKRFVARFRLKGAREHLGSYSTPEEAARAYDRAARSSGLPEWQMNFPEGLE